MIYLGNSHKNIQIVADQWELMLREFLFKKHKKKLSIRKDGKETIYFNTYYAKMKGEVKNCDGLDAKKKRVMLCKLRRFRKNLRRIVLAEEGDLSKYSKHEERSKSKIIKNNKVWDLKKAIMTNLYEDFTQEKNVDGVNNAHYFFRKLDIRTCPYCNRHYTFTLDDGTVKVSPEYDHFFDKSSYPILAVSFYNLVPSCHTCNLVKRNNKAKINPYFSGFKRKFELQNKNGERMLLDEIINQEKEGRIGFGKLGDSEEEIKRFKEEQCNIDTFGLQGLYEMHDDYISEIIEKTMRYNPTVNQALADAFQDQAYSPQQVDDFVWGKYLNVAQYEKRPLSKLTRDILEQLGMLPDNEFH